MPDPLNLRAESTSSPIDRLSEALGGAEPDEIVAVRADADPTLLVAPNRKDRLPPEMTFRFRDILEDHWQLEVKHLDTGSGEFPTVDVRNIIPQRRHEILLETFDALETSEGFVLLNDHDPKPLSHELRSTRGDIFEWDYQSREPGAWRVAIQKTADRTPSGSDATTIFDIREIPSPEAYDSIEHRFGMLPDGATIEIVAEHEPRDLQRKLKQTHDDEFEWKIVYADPDEFRLQLTKTADSEPGSVETTEQGPKLDITQKLDVRDRPPAQRHEAIFDAYEALELGEGFMLVNDHDPKPLYHQFEAEAGNAFYWEYRQREPREFRVLIGKTERQADSRATPGESDPLL